MPGLFRTSGSSGAYPVRNSPGETQYATPRAGHLVPAYTVGNLPFGKHALTMYNQAMAGKPISST